MKVRPVGSACDTVLRKTLSLHSCPEGVRWPVVGDWSSTVNENDPSNAWNLNVKRTGKHGMNNNNRTNQYAVRPFQH